jgi:hypothetical protein
MPPKYMPDTTRRQNSPPASSKHRDGKKVDRAEAMEQIDPVDEEARERRDDHQRHPDLAEQPVPWRALRPGQQIGAKDCCRHDGKDVDLNGKGRIEQWLEGHGRLRLKSPPVSGMTAFLSTKMA